LSTATLNGVTVTRGRLAIPAWGVWYAEVTLDDAATLEGRAELVIADLTMVGTILSGGPVEGAARYRVVGGNGGWARELEPRSYANDAGVKASTVLTDAALLATEHLDPATIPPALLKLGPAWVRPRARAGRVLEQLAPRNWYVGADGITRIGQRPTVTLDTPAARIDPDPSLEVVTLASETLAELVPGAVVDGLEAVDVEHTISAEYGLRSTLWGKRDGGSSRRLSALAKLIEELQPDRRFRGLSEYRVVTQDGERLNLQPVRVSVGMPDLSRVPVRPGIAGARAEVTLGSRVVVGFLDASPARPVVLGFEAPDGEGHVGPTVALDADSVELGAAVAEVIRNGELLTITGQLTVPIPLLPNTPTTAVITQAVTVIDPTSFGSQLSKVKA
jgi:hypothetical protein